jgi:poly(3-hydroxyalkanoate) synthetase
VGTDDTTYEVVPSGHVGAVVGSKGPAQLYPTIADWFTDRATIGG